MYLGPHVESLQRQLALAAEAGGDEARALGERLIAPLDAAIRLTLLDVLTAAAEEITCELAPGSVEVRLRGRDPELVVAPAPADLSAEDPAYADHEGASRARPVTGVAAPGSIEGDEGAMSRINLRMPDQLKARIEHAAGSEGLSVNAWLVRAAAGALERGDPGPRRGPRVPRGTQRYTGWAR
ncbi:MAG: toxin-antitoxin system HicB family antitoxin [Solirubrobacteraceae bacterium]